jgi:hypothetical protein
MPINLSNNETSGPFMAQSVSLRGKAMSGVGGKADLPVERPDFSV